MVAMPLIDTKENIAKPHGKDPRGLEVGACESTCLVVTLDPHDHRLRFWAIYSSYGVMHFDYSLRDIWAIESMA